MVLRIVDVVEIMKAIALNFQTIDLLCVPKINVIITFIHRIDYNAINVMVDPNVITN